LDPLRLTQHVHGHLGWLAAALLIHPAIVLRDRRRRAHLAVVLAASFVTVAAAGGASIYVAYRDQLRQAIFVTWPAIGLLMERKEHLAFASLVLTWAGTAAYFGAPKANDDGMRDTLRLVAFRSFACAAALAIVAAVLGTIVAVHKSF
jgi:hypothetical protein